MACFCPKRHYISKDFELDLFLIKILDSVKGQRLLERASLIMVGTASRHSPFTEHGDSTNDKQLTKSPPSIKGRAHVSES
jgi:hypothetical protein